MFSQRNIYPNVMSWWVRISMSGYDTKDRSVAIVLALFLGGLGAHRFYLGEFKKGALYLVFCWTFIPLFVALYDAFRYFRHPELFRGGPNAASTMDWDESVNSRTTQSAVDTEPAADADTDWESTKKPTRDTNSTTSDLASSASGIASSVKRGASAAKDSASKAARNANERAQEASEKAQEASEQPETPPDAEMAVAGVNGTVTLYSDRLEISREGIGMAHKLQHGFKGDKEIALDSITSVQLRKPTSRTRGYIQFGQSGYSESDDGILDAVSDENTVLFNKGALPLFEDLRAAVREHKNGNVEATTSTMDGAMEKLRERYASGDIDEEEYEKRKKVLQDD